MGMAHRKHLVGIDDRRFTSIRGQADLKPHLRVQAREHELHRLESVAEVLCLVAIMIRQGVLTGRETVSAEAAIYQFGTGSLVASVQAAHCLPGQLKFDGQPFHLMANWSKSTLLDRGLKPIPLDGKLRNLSGRTDLVDTLINQTDSYLEIMSRGQGLKFVLAHTTGQMIRQPALVPSASWPTVRKVVVESMAAYRRNAVSVCQQRVEDVVSRNKPALLGQPPGTDQYKAAIVLEYMQVLLSNTLLPEPLNLSAFRWLLRDVMVQP